MNNKESLIKIVLAVLMFLCLANMPYGFYQSVRFVAFIGFGILAFNAKQQEQNSKVLIYISLALLFQPFLKIALGRELWNIVDVIVAIGLIISTLKNKKH